MTNEEALAYEIDVRQNYENITDEGWKIVVNALLKQAPKKPRDCYMSRVNATFHWVCDCGTYFNTDELPKYCPECGQKLDFSGGWD